MYTPSDLFIRLDFDGVASQFSDPVRIVTAWTVEEVVPALTEVERAAADGLWAAGYIGYEAAPAFDTAFGVRPGGSLPLLCFGLFARRSTPPDVGSRNYTVSEWSMSTSPAEHAAAVDSIREAIAGGYTYQVNYTMRLQAGFDGDSYAYYRHLLRQGRAQYSAYINLGRHQILSVSPELFFRRDPMSTITMTNATSPSPIPMGEGAGGEGSRIQTRPMKGTVARGRWLEEDDERRRWLKNSDKNRAENVMIVDLLRNDLGRIAEIGSVQTSDLFHISAYPTVFQMTSTVAAKLKPSTTLTDIFRALFPCGSVTGAPKISTMSLIAELETSPRGVYCGSIGMVMPSGQAVFNVAIRTLTVDTATNTAEYGVGGGITWDSTADDEYVEAASKTAVLTDALPNFDLLETLRLDDGEYDLLDRHVNRIVGSAAYFLRYMSTQPVYEALADFARSHRTGDYRVRLLVSEGGDIKVEGQPLGPLPAKPIVAIATAPVDIRDRFLYHKTTHRALYEHHKSQHPGAFDVLLWNERGEATEFTIGNLVVEIDGKKYTPPIESGLLPGTMRAELLANGEIEERVVMLEEVKRASTIWLVNSVRGWVEVSLVNRLLGNFKLYGEVNAAVDQ